MVMNRAQLFTLFGLANLVLDRRHLLALYAQVHPECVLRALRR